jgi:hypothetical protein
MTAIKSYLGYNLLVTNDSDDIVIGYIEGDIETVIELAEKCGSDFLGSVAITDQDEQLKYQFNIFDIYDDHTRFIC